MPRVRLTEGQKFIQGIQPDPPCLQCPQARQDFCKHEHACCRGFYDYILAAADRKGVKDFQPKGVASRKLYRRLYA